MPYHYLQAKPLKVMANTLMQRGNSLAVVVAVMAYGVQTAMAGGKVDEAAWSACARCVFADGSEKTKDAPFQNGCGGVRPIVLSCGYGT
jgi:hypothetical protein